MKKLAIRAVGAVVALAVLGAGGAWYVVSGRVMTQAEQLIADANKATHADGSSLKITYASLTRTTFPAVGVRVVDPVIEFSAPGDAAGTPAVSGTWKRVGATDIVTDYLAHEYRMVSHGHGQVKLQSGEQKFQLSTSDAPIRVAVKARSYAAFNRWGALNLKDSKAVEAALGDVAVATIDTGAITMKDDASGAVLYSQEQASFNLVNRSTATHKDFDVVAVLKGSETTKQYGDFVQHMMDLMQVKPAMNIAQMPFAAERAGKQDIDIAASINIPQEGKGATSDDGFIRVQRFNFKNNFYSMKMPLEIVLSSTQQRRNASVKLDWMLDVTPAGAEEIKNVIGLASGVLPGMVHPENSEQPAAGTEQLNQKILAALPTLSTLGAITLVADIEADIPEVGGSNAGKHIMGGEVITIRKLALNHKRWGIEAAGDAKRNDKAEPSINLTLQCKQCTAMTKDIFVTANQVQEVANLMQPDHPQQWGLSETTLANLDAALAEIGRKNATTGDIDFTISTPAPNDIRINDKPLGEAMMRLMAAMAPADAAQQAPAAGEVTQ